MSEGLTDPLLGDTVKDEIKVTREALMYSTSFYIIGISSIQTT